MHHNFMVFNFEKTLHFNHYSILVAVGFASGPSLKELQQKNLCVNVPPQALSRTLIVSRTQE